MPGEILYEMKYPHAAYEEAEHLYSEARMLPPEIERQDAQSALHEIFEDRIYVALPECEEGQEYFIKMAKETAAYYEMDIVIKRLHNRIEASIDAACYVSFPMLKNVILLADEVGFYYREDTVVLVLDYYTHVLVHSPEKAVMPTGM